MAFTSLVLLGTLHFTLFSRTFWSGLSIVPPSATCRRALKVAIEDVMPEIDFFISSTEIFNHFGSQEEVEEQCVRWRHRALVCEYRNLGKCCVFAFRGSGDHIFGVERVPFFRGPSASRTARPQAFFRLHHLQCVLSSDVSDIHLNDCSNDCNSIRRRSQLHACARHVAHI